MKKLHPIPMSRIRRAIKDAYWWVRHRIDPNHRYHLVNTGLRPNYYDIDHLMLHACFALLERYVSEEMGGVDEIEEFNRQLREQPEKWGGGDPAPGANAQADRQAEAVALYEWWTIERPLDEARVDDLTEQLFGKNGLINIRFVPIEGFDGRKMEISELSDTAKALEAELEALEKKITAEEQSMLHRLIDIRTSLWT